MRRQRTAACHERRHDDYQRRSTERQNTQHFRAQAIVHWKKNAFASRRPKQYTGVDAKANSLSCVKRARVRRGSTEALLSNAAGRLTGAFAHWLRPTVATVIWPTGVRQEVEMLTGFRCSVFSAGWRRFDESVTQSIDFRSCALFISTPSRWLKDRHENSYITWLHASTGFICRISNLKKK